MVINEKAKLEEILNHAKAEREEVKRELETLGSIKDKNDEVQQKIDRLEEQKQILDDVIGLFDDLSDFFGDIDCVIEKIKQVLPGLATVGKTYGKEIGDILGQLMDLVTALGSSQLKNRDELYERRAAEMKIYFDKLVKAGFPENVAATIVARQGAPYSLEQMLSAVFKQVQFQIEID